MLHIRPVWDKALSHDGLRAVYQPIVRLDSGAVVAHEGLMRWHSGSSQLSPLALLSVARAEGQLRELELRAAKVILDRFSYPLAEGKLFINLSTQVIAQERCRPDSVLASLAGTGQDLGRFVIELTEQDIAKDPARLLEAIACLRSAGVCFALDDFGNGNSNFELWNEVRPDLVKIDRYLIDGVATSRERLAIVQAVQEAARVLGARLVAEGLEREADLRRVRDLGIEYGQGFLLGRPVPIPVAALGDEAARLFGYLRSSMTVSHAALSSRVPSPSG
jgi:EAL domain-containing protein (putative c-di-GMP-specific phosphodiesterase class I)